MSPILHRRHAAAAVLLALAAFLPTPPLSHAARSHGETARLDTPCRTALADLYAAHYPPVPPATVSPCALTIEQALATKKNERCPDAGALAACFEAAPPGAWSAFVHRCALFSTAPADPAAVAAAETAAAAAAAAPASSPIMSFLLEGSLA